jgi:hypothetical protein
MLGCRLVVDWQVAKRDNDEEREEDEAVKGPALTATPSVTHRQKRSTAKKED